MNMSNAPSSRSLRILSGGDTAHLVVDDGGGGGTEEVVDAAALSLEEARKEAYRQGQAQAQEQAAEERRELERQNARLAAELPAAWAQDLQVLETTVAAAVTDLALAIGEVICRSRVCRAETIRAAVDEALEQPLISESIRVRCHPEDVAVLQGAAQEDSSVEISVAPDPSLKGGDVCIETGETGDLDGRLQTRLGVLKERLAQSGGDDNDPSVEDQ